MDYRIITAALDDVADRLEKQGLVKEAYDLDKVADLIEAAIPYGHKTVLSDALFPVLTKIKKENIRDLEQVRNLLIGAIEKTIGKGVSQENANRYIEEFKAHNKLSDLLIHAGNLALKSENMGTKLEHQQESA